MPDRRKHRGKHPDDDRLFAPDQIDRLRQAVADHSWLLSNGYAPDSSLKLVGDRYDLTARRRLAVMRSSCSDDALRGRESRRVEPSALKGNSLAIDGYNLLITVESALSGGVILIGRDGCYRDLASIHGTYRKVEETAPAVELIADVLEEFGPARVDFYLDQPVSNSGRLRKYVQELLEERAVTPRQSVNWTVELAPSPDNVLRTYNGVIATSDSAVLDACNRWVKR